MIIAGRRPDGAEFRHGFIFVAFVVIVFTIYSNLPY